MVCYDSSVLEGKMAKGLRMAISKGSLYKGFFHIFCYKEVPMYLAHSGLTAFYRKSIFGGSFNDYAFLIKIAKNWLCLCPQNKSIK